MNFIDTAKRLRIKGILGINQRNCDYTLMHNPRHLYPLVDDKLKTKKLALAAGLAVPKLYGLIEEEHEIRDLTQLLQPYEDFVIKPAHGSGGDGVLVVTGRSKSHYRLANGSLMDQDEMDYYVSNILSGLFSLGGHSDNALIEYRVQFDMVFSEISFQGVPDIRIVVFLGVPVMAMVRLPTRQSDGKANLHQGAIGAGINIATGETLTGVYKNQIITEHPDTNHSVTGLLIPHWDKLLVIAAEAYELTGLGYLGIDIVLDKDQGPLILEFNARPGLNIQLANQSGLLPRLKAVEEFTLNHKHSSQERIDFAKTHWSMQT